MADGFFSYRGLRVTRSSTTLLSLAIAISSASIVGAQLPPFIEMRVPKAPTVATGENGSFLTYEVHITNFMGQPLTLKKLDAMAASDNRVLMSFADSALMRAIARPGAPTTQGADKLKIAPGARAIAFLWVPIAAGTTAPTQLVNRLSIEQGSGDSVRTAQLDGNPIPVAMNAVVIGPPLRGGVWLAANGPADASGHRRALIPVAGTPAIAQRFAIDWVKVADDDKTFKGDQLKNESYYAEGLDALAVANGTVVAVKDSIPENVPGINSRAVPITLETVGGNHVIIDIGGGNYAFYAHLKPGSLRVKKGDRETRGQVVGLVGNTGNSTEPHLHFHISDGNSPLGSEGLPYRMDFEVVGRCKMLGASCERSTPVVRRGEVPLANVLVRFP
jgi:hypothetical protein